MRIVPMERILELVPETRGASGSSARPSATTRRSPSVVETLASQGREVGPLVAPARSDERPLRCGARKAGHKTLTTAIDGASQRCATSSSARRKEKHFIARGGARARARARSPEALHDGRAAGRDRRGHRRARPLRGRALAHRTDRRSGSRRSCRSATRRSTACRSPASRWSSAGSRGCGAGVHGRVDVRATSARWAWVEHVLAQGGAAEGRAVLDAVRGGGGYRDYQRAFAALPVRNESRGGLPVVA